MHFSIANVPLPARFRPNTPMDEEELLRFCTANDDLRVEREANGDILIMTPAGNWTGRKNAYLLFSLAQWADQDGRGYYFDSNTGFTLPDGSMRSPDAAWVSSDKWDALPEDDKRRFSHISPEFIVELRSDSDALLELQAKMELWIANGVLVGWLIDPIEQAVTIYRPGQAPEVHKHPTSVQGDGIMTGFELVMERFWA